ncbi:MAG: DUF2007 domain-containing protein [Phycisphaerae bacterium]|nr:DUF2007 domain-containing protein [Phycisphaerae bacterium]
MERSRRNKGNRSATRPKDKEYVIVTVVEDPARARDYKELLEDSDIPVMLREQEGFAGERCLSILVPEENLDEAHVIIEAQETHDDFYDMGMEDDEEEDEEDEHGVGEDDEDY